MKRRALSFVLVATFLGGCPDTTIGPDTPLPLDASADASDGARADTPGLDVGVDAPAMSDVPMLPFDGGEDVGAGEDAGEAPMDADLPDVMLGDAGGILCGGGQVDCGGVCTDLMNDSASCGACGRACGGPRVVSASCTSGACSVASCELLYADANGDAADGCEAMQDFALTTSTADITLSAGGSTSLDIALERIFGFPYSISVTITDVPPSLTIDAVGPTIGSSGTLGLSASPTATAGTFAARVVAGTTVGATSITREVPLTVHVVTSPVAITSVEVLRGLVPMPSNQAPQGAGELTLRVRGTGLTTAVSASLGVPGLALTPVVGGTATLRDYTVVVPHGIAASDAGQPLTLTLTTASGPATFARALVLTSITAAAAGSDFSGLGTPSSPVATIDRAFALAGARDVVLLDEGTYAAPTTTAPDGLTEVHGRGAAVIACAGGTALRFSSSANVRRLEIRGCDVGIATSAGASLLVDDVDLIDTVLPIAADGSTVHLDHVTLTGCGTTDLHGGALTLTRVDTDSGFTTDNAVVQVIASSFHGIAGTALSLGAALGPHGIDGSDFTSCGTAIELAPAARATIGATSVAVSSSTGIRVRGGAHLEANGLWIVDGGSDGIALEGAAPELVVNGEGLRVAANAGVGVLVAPASGTSIVSFTSRMTIEGNGGGLEIRNAAGATTNVTTADLLLRSNGAFGLRVIGGTTTMTSARVDLETSAAGALGIDLVSGTGTIGFRGGRWLVPSGSGLRVGASAQHTISVGESGARTAIVLTGHAYDFTFGIEDARAGAAPAPFIDVRADFVGSDAAPRSWSASYRATRGSYSSDVTPRDLAAWLVRFQGGLRFVP